MDGIATPRTFSGGMTVQSEGDLSSTRGNLCMQGCQQTAHTGTGNHVRGAHAEHDDKWDTSLTQTGEVPRRTRLHELGTRIDGEALCLIEWVV